MPIEIRDADDGKGNIIVGRGTVTDLDIVSSLQNHLTTDQNKFKFFNYLLIDHTSLTKMDISDETIESTARLITDTSKAFPDIIVAVAVNATMGVSIEHVNKISRLYDVFIHPSNWETMVFRTKAEAVRWLRKKVSHTLGI